MALTVPGPWRIHVSPVIHMNTDLGVAVRGFCQRNEGLTSVDLNFGRLTLDLGIRDREARDNS